MYFYNKQFQIGFRGEKTVYRVLVYFVTLAVINIGHAKKESDAPSEKGDAEVGVSDENNQPENGNTTYTNELGASVSICVKNLDQETKKNYFRLLREATKLSEEGKYVEALKLLGQAEKICPDYAKLLNLMGTNFMGLRHYELAEQAFAKAIEQAPAYYVARFNLANLNFVRGKYEEAMTGFTQLLKTWPLLHVKHVKIIDYKILLCLCKLNRMDVAKIILNKYDIFDDHPIYYYGSAAMEFSSGNESEGFRWLESAKNAKYSKQLNVIYSESMNILGWIILHQVDDDKADDMSTVIKKNQSTKNSD